VKYPDSEAIPDSLLFAPISVKCLYLYLNGKGTVSYSTRELARILGFPQNIVCMAFDVFKNARVIIFEQEPFERFKPIFRVLTCEEIRQREQAEADIL
jgi:hypothetical protein